MNPFKDFKGFNQLKSIKSETIVLVIKDVLNRINSSFDNFRAQTYDGAFNMMKKKNGVSAVKSLSLRLILHFSYNFRPLKYKVKSKMKAFKYYSFIFFGFLSKS